MDCHVFKRPGDTWIHGRNGQARRLRAWMAVCPQCGTEVRPASFTGGGILSSYQGWVTRKMAKDALHRHLREARHVKPGLVGTRSAHKR